MQNKLSKTRFLLAALLLTVIVLPVSAQYQEPELSPEAKAAIEKYDSRTIFIGGFSKVSLNGKYGLINTNGEEIVPCKYDYVSYFHENMVEVRLNGKYGFFDIHGKEVVPCKYDCVWSYNNGTAKVVYKGCLGQIDANGKYTYSHDIILSDFEWLFDDWAPYDDCNGDPVLTIISDGKAIEDWTTKTARLVYDKKTEKYFVVCSKEGEKDTKYQLDFTENELVKMDGTRLVHRVFLKKEAVQEPKPEPSLELESNIDEIFHSAAIMPSFPGGNGALMNYLSSHVQYPTAAKDNGIQGKVIVQFVVEKDGRIGEVKVVRGVDKDLDREAVRVCKSLPRFSPGLNANREPVRVWYTMPVTFKLNDE